MIPSRIMFLNLISLNLTVFNTEPNMKITPHARTFL